jgi:hypothetical protein
MVGGIYIYMYIKSISPKTIKNQGSQLNNRLDPTDGYAYMGSGPGQLPPSLFTTHHDTWHDLVPGTIRSGTWHDQIIT